MMPESQLTNYVMFVHPSFRITVGGNFTPILQLLKMMGQEAYNKQVKELCTDISRGSNLEFIGEYIDDKENISFVFIDRSTDLIDVAELYFKDQNINGRVSKIIFSAKVEKDSPICIAENCEDDMLEAITWREEKNKETGEVTKFHNYPHMYDVLNPIFEKKNDTENQQCSESQCCSCCDE